MKMIQSGYTFPYNVRIEFQNYKVWEVLYSAVSSINGVLYCIQRGPVVNMKVVHMVSLDPCQGMETN